MKVEHLPEAWTLRGLIGPFVVESFTVDLKNHVKPVGILGNPDPIAYVTELTELRGELILVTQKTIDPLSMLGKFFEANEFCRQFQSVIRIDKWNGMRGHDAYWFTWSHIPWIEPREVTP